MSLGEPVVIVLGVLLLAVAGIRFLRRCWSPQNRQERRRRRSNAPITTSAKRPMVKFSVNPRTTKRK